MINDSFFHYVPTSSRNFYNRSPFDIFYDPEEEEQNLIDVLAQEQRRRQAALEEAYIEELQRRKQRRLYEEELERRRLKKLQEQTLQRERQRRIQLQRLYEEELERKRMALERQKAVAVFEKQLRWQKQKEEFERRRHEQAAKSKRPIYHLVQGPDGCLYRILLQRPTHCQNEADKVHMRHIPSDASLSSESSAKTESVDERSDEEKEVKEKPIFKNVTFNININDSDGKEVTNADAKKKSRKKSSKKAKVVVEDASDSECEDAFGDYFHNRRPTTTWIEPVEGLNVKTFR